MSRFKMKFPGSGGGDDPTSPPAGSSFDGVGAIGGLIVLLLIAGIVYSCYFWFFRRVVVGPDEVLVLMKKNGSRSLPADQIIIPRPPEKPELPKNPSDPDSEAVYQRKLAEWTQATAAWETEYADVNGILEEIYPAGTYFRFSPFDYERDVIKIGTTADVPQKKVGIVIKKFGTKLPPNQVLADPKMNQRGPLPQPLAPGRHLSYANPYAYTIEHVDPLQVDPGYRGVATIMAGSPAVSPNSYLVESGEQGIQRQTEPEGFFYVNPFEKRITPISIRSQRLEMSGNEQIQFPSSDSFDIKLEGFVEWSIMPDRLPETYAKYSEGAELIPLVEQTMILPYARSYSRLVGSQYHARDFISGETRLKFQEEFETKLREACAKQGVEILQALVRDIIPPQEIKEPINEREIAREQILKYEQQIIVAETSSRLAKQEEMSNQNRAIGAANQEVVTVVKLAEQERDVAVTKAEQDLAVAKLRLEAAQKQADALVARGQAEANVILLQKQAQAEPLRQQINAFGGGDSYARYFFYLQVAPSVKSILSNSDGPFADLFNQFTTPLPPDGSAERLTGANGREP